MRGDLCSNEVKKQGFAPEARLLLSLTYLSPMQKGTFSLNHSSPLLSAVHNSSSSALIAVSDLLIILT